MNNYMYVSLVLGLSACHVGQTYQIDEFINEKDIQENLNLKSDINKISKITPDWYKIFNDQDLNCLVHHALTNNLTVKQVIERLKQSRLAFEIHAKDFYPMIEASGSYNFNRVNNTHTYAFDTNIFKLGVDASWELDIWGRGSYISEQYYEFMNSVSYSLLDTKVSLTGEVIRNYINLREAQEKLRIAHNNLRLQRDILQTVQDKFKAGISDELDLNQAKFTVENTKSIIPPLKFEIENYKNSLAVLLGVPPQKLPINLDQYKYNPVFQPFKYNVQNLYTLPLDVIRNRPDILSSEAIIKEKNAKINEAITNLYPSVTLEATFGFISPSGHSLFDNKSQTYGYLPQVSLPIWNWRQLKNNIELQKHIRDEYLLNYNEAILTALSEIKSSIDAVEQAYKHNYYSQTSLKNMQNILSLTKEKYKNGLVDFTDLAYAEQNLLKVQNNLASSNAQILQSLTSFYKTIGGGYTFR